MALFEKILVPTDFGPPSMRAIAMAVELAKLNGASLALVHVWELPSAVYGMSLPPGIAVHLEAEARAQLASVVEDAEEHVPVVEAHVECGTPWREILRTIEPAKPALVVMGTQGRRGLGHAVLGSVAEKLVRVSPVPVLIVR